MPEPAQSHPDVVAETHCLIRENQWEGRFKEALQVPSAVANATRTHAEQGERSTLHKLCTNRGTFHITLTDTVYTLC